MTTATATRQTTFRWLAKQLGTMDGYSYDAVDAKHWLKKARLVVAANPQTPQELNDVIVNFKSMIAPVTQRESVKFQNVLDAMQGRHFVEELSK